PAGAAPGGPSWAAGRSRPPPTPTGRRGGRRGWDPAPPPGGSRGVPPPGRGGAHPGPPVRGRPGGRPRAAARPRPRGPRRRAAGTERRGEQAGGVRMLLGEAAIGWDGHELLVVGQDGARRVAADALVVATGARPLGRAEAGIEGGRPAGILAATVACHLAENG